MVEITTRYLGVLTYAGVAAIALFKDLIGSVQDLTLVLAPIAIFITADMYKHRADL